MTKNSHIKHTTKKTPFQRSVEKERRKGTIKERGGEDRGVERGSSVYVTIKTAFGSNTTPLLKDRLGWERSKEV